MFTKIKNLKLTIGAALYQSALLGILFNTATVVWSEIERQTGLPTTVYTFNLTLRNLTGIIFGAILSSIFYKSDKKKYLIMNIFVMTLSYAMWTIEPGSIAWYASSTVQGIAFCTASILVPAVINERNVEKPATITGIAMSASGFAGVVFSPLAAFLISRLGWKNEIFIMCLITLIFGLMGVALLFDENDSKVVTRQTKTMKMADSNEFEYGSFIGIVLVLAGCVVTSQETGTIGSIMRSNGYNLEQIAMFNSLLMIGNIGGKLVFGVCCDKLGVFKTILVCYLTTILSVLSFIFMPENYVVMCISSVLLGFVLAIYIVGISASCSAVFGKYRMKRYVGFVVSINSVILMIASFIMSLIVDRTSSFNFYHYICIIACTTSSLASLVFERRINRRKENGRK